MINADVQRYKERLQKLRMLARRYDTRNKVSFFELLYDRRKLDRLGPGTEQCQDLGLWADFWLRRIDCGI